MFKLARYLRHYKKESILGPLFKLFEACMELAVPLIMASVIDVGVKNADTPYILKMAGVLVLFGVAGLLFSVTAQYFAAKAAFGFGTELRRDLFAHINRFSYTEIDKIGTSTLVTRITSDVNAAQTGVNLVLRLFLRSPFIVLGSLIMALTIDVKLTLIFLAAVPVLSLIIYSNMSSTMPIYKKVQRQLEKIALITRENLAGVRVIRAFSRQNAEKSRFDEETDTLYGLQMKAGNIAALLNPLTYAVVNLAIMLIIWFGGKTVDKGMVTQGEVIALVNYMIQILNALVAVATLIISASKAQASAVRINEVFDCESTLTDDGNTVQTAKSKNAVEFKNVSFAYAGSKEPAVSDISFTAKHGETIGIIGGTGSGKSTLVNLISRFYDATAGEVLIDGANAKAYPFEQLRRKIGVVPQKAVLFRGTIRDNMKWGKNDASDEEINRALEIAQAADVVASKKKGLDEMISQGGTNLSGGQRQRLTIARALTGSPEILILDDSASALDFATDARLRKAIAEKTKGMTVFIVSQRASTIKNADKIIVLDDGEVAGMGKHEELFENCGVYREICLSQLSAEEVRQ